MSNTIIITGATSGFGKAIAELFAANKYRIIITGRRNERLIELKDSLLSKGASEVLSLCFDVRDKEQTASVISSLPDGWRKIDILVNNAGLAVGMNHIDKGDIDDWERMIDTNLKGLLYVTRAVTPLMVERGSGHVINIGSIAGRDSYENGNVYCATKSAVDMLSRTMRIDLLKDNIKVTHIAPGMADTEFSLVRFKGDSERAAGVYTGITALSADDIANAVYYCATLPPHVCINDLVITCTQQANAFTSYRK